MPRILPERCRIAFTRLLNGVLPQSCLLCGSDCSALLCTACESDLPRLGSACPQCAEPTTHGERCGRCLMRPPHFDAAFVPFRYDFPLDKLLHAYKYGGKLALGRWFGLQIAAHLDDHHFDCVIPMPLHPGRLRERGFNQAAELGRHIGSEMGWPVKTEDCRRIRPTTPQAELPLKRRAANVRGAFECCADYTGRSVLLVDDVMTTGATLNECARVLKLHGATAVMVAAVGRAARH